MKTRLFKVLVLVTAMVFAGSLVSAQQPLQDAQKRLLAKRAAQADAYRKLAEVVKGLQIDSQTYVRDFVAESDYVQTAFDDFIKGAHIVGRPRYLPDGTCEVDVEMTIEEIVNGLIEIAKHTTFGHRYRFQQMTQYVQEKVVRATGVGLPRGEEPQISLITSGIPGWEDVTTRGRLMAERAALVDGYRNLAETVKGIRITGQTYVRDFVAESDYVQTSLDTFIKGAHIVGGYRYLPDGEVEVTVEVTVQQVVKQLRTIQEHLVQRGWGWRRDIFRTINFEEIVAYLPAKVVQATGNGVVPLKYRTGGQLEEAVPISNPGVAMPSWATEVVSAIGTGVPPSGVTGTEAKLMATRAAEVDARRQLAEKVYGVHINATTTVLDYVVQNDVVKADVETFLAGASISEPRYLDDGSVEVTASLPLEDLAEIIQ